MNSEFSTHLSDFYLRRGGISHAPLRYVPAWTAERLESSWRRGFPYRQTSICPILTKPSGGWSRGTIRQLNRRTDKGLCSSQTT